MTRRLHQKDQYPHLVGGFTLMEMLVVLAVIGILASFVIVRLSEARRTARAVQARAEVNQIRKAISMLENDTGEWPGHRPIDDVQSGISGGEMWNLNIPGAGLVATDGAYVRWRGPYITTVPFDPWGNSYFFDPDYDVDPGAGQTWAAVVGSFGPNGIGQNVYDSDDIYEILTSE